MCDSLSLRYVILIILVASYVLTSHEILVFRYLAYVILILYYGGGSFHLIL